MEAKASVKASATSKAGSSSSTSSNLRRSSRLRQKTPAEQPSPTASIKPSPKKTRVVTQKGGRSELSEMPIIHGSDGITHGNSYSGSSSGHSKQDRDQSEYYPTPHLRNLGHQEKSDTDKNGHHSDHDDDGPHYRKIPPTADFQRTYDVEERVFKFLEEQENHGSLWRVWKQCLNSWPLFLNPGFLIWWVVRTLCLWLRVISMATVSAIVFIPRLCISSASLHPSWLQGQGTRVVWSIKQSIRAFYLSKRICMLILVALAVGSTYYIDAYLTDLPGYPDIHGPKHDSLATISRIPRTFITTITRRFKELSAWYPSSLPKRRQQRMRSNKNTGTGMGMSDHQLAIEQLQKSTHQLAKHVEKLQKSDYQQADHIEQLQRSRHQQAKSIESLQESDNQKTNHIEQIQRSHHQLVKDFESTKQLDRRITSTEHQLNTLKSYINDGQWVNQVLDALWDKLPEHLAVSKDLRTGKIQVSPEFLGLVKSMFVTKREVYEYFDEALGHHFPGESLNQWQKFLKDNDQALKSTSRHYLKVSKDEYLKVLDSEARAIWDGIKDAVTDSLATLPHHNLTDLVYQVTMKLLGEASGRSSLDLVTERDYALSTIGGEIIPEMTFPDFEVQMKPTLLGRLGLKYLISPNPQVEKRAIRAIEDDISPASCWAMKGDQGQIGIQLARKIIATHITIEHSDPRVTLDASSAPREMEIWMLPSSPDTSTRDRGYRHARQRETTDGPPERGASLLTKIEYHNPSATTKGGLPNIVQSFPIPSPEQNDPAVGVVIRIKSNWGHPDFTCIYRIRVHGHEP